MSQGFYGTYLYSAPCGTSVSNQSFTGAAVSANCGSIANPVVVSEWDHNSPFEGVKYTGSSAVAIDALGGMHEEAYIALQDPDPNEPYPTVPGSTNPTQASAGASADLVDYSMVTGPTGPSAFMNITYTMDGSISEWGNTLWGYNSAGIDASVGIASEITIYTWSDPNTSDPNCYASDRLVPDTPPLYGTYAPGTFSVSYTATCQVSAGEQLRMETQMQIGAFIEGNVLSGGYYTGNGGEEFNFGNTAGITSITFTDGSGNPVSGFGLSSTGGIAYDDLIGTPEPATLTLWGAGLGVLAFWRRRSRARTR
jgi:hypothetical protein